MILQNNSMSNSKSVTKNYLYNLIYQILLIIIPIITTPYVSRVLGADGVGKFSFSNSITSYFVIFASLGFGYYAQREIAKHQDNKKKQTEIFWEIIIVRFASVLTVLTFYFIAIALGVFKEEYTILMIILSINILSIAFDISFLFAGNEVFSKTVLTNTFLRILNVIAIFVFVKDRNDLWKYALITALTVLIANASLTLFSKDFLCKIEIKSLKPIRHIKPAVILFLPTIAVSVYAYLDKTMIGVITGSDFENGFYEQAEKIVKMVMTVVTSLGTVMIPRNANAFERKDMEAIRQNIYRSIRFVLLLGIPMMIGLIAVSDNMVPWFLGEGYYKSANIMKILSVLILAIGLNNVFGLQYLIPAGEDKKFTVSVTCGAITNFLLNLVLIRLFKSYGAALATIVAETVVAIIMFCFIRKNISFVEICKSSVKYLISGVIMFVPCFIVGRILEPSIINTFVIVFIGVVVYLICLILLKDGFFFETANRLISRLPIKKHS